MSEVSCVDDAIKSAVPSTPVVTKVGAGTAVKVYKFTRFTPNGVNQSSSPWVVKKVTTKHRLTGIAIRRLHNEARILRQLDHECIVKIKMSHSSPLAAVQQDVSSLSLEYGGSCLARLLERIFESDGKSDVLKPENCLKIISDLVGAIYYLHNQVMVLHGDIKSDNVLFDATRNIAKLCDFGVSLNMKKHEDSRFLIRENVSEEYNGANLYTPPEVWHGSRDVEEVEITDRCDIWAFGLLLYEMMTLRPPYISEAQQNLNDSISDDFDLSLDHLIGTKPNLNAEECSGNNLFFHSNTVIELFHACTEVNYCLRPSIVNIYHAWSSPT